MNAPTLPPGADPGRTDDWESNQGRVSRLVWSYSRPMPEHLAEEDIRVVASQRPDGSIVAADPEDATLIYVGGTAYEPRDARILATEIAAAADLADEWVNTYGRVEVRG